MRMLKPPLSRRCRRMWQSRWRQHRRKPGRCLKSARAMHIFGGPPPSQDAVEKASRGEPVSARARATTAIDAVVPRQKESLESRLGARWAVWVGGIALALGGVFMVKYSIDAGLLSPAVRLSMAAVFGLVLMAIGEFVRRRAVPLVADAFPERDDPRYFDGCRRGDVVRRLLCRPLVSMVSSGR